MIDLADLDIAALVPHQGAMCLWQRVVSFDENGVCVASLTHRDPLHPLRSDEMLKAIHLCEYGAQAMAVHGGLLAHDGGQPRRGFLVALRGVKLHLARIDTLPDELVCHAELLIDGESSQQYQFRIVHAGQLIAEGRAAVMLESRDWLNPDPDTNKAALTRLSHNPLSRSDDQHALPNLQHLIHTPRSTMMRALVTGGSGDIGGAICRALAAAGHHVIVHANRNPSRAQAVVDDIAAEGGSAEAVVFDVSNADASRVAIDKLLENGPVQIVVNNAGIHDDAPMAGMNEAQWKRVIDVSLHGFFHVTQPLLLPMARKRWGRIINISSVAAVLGNRGQTNYSAAKAALHGASKSLAREMASRGITVNVIAPGVIAGSMTESVFPAEQIKAMVPAARAGTPQEVAALAAFLSSDAAGYINGQVIGIDGGMS